MCDNVQYQVDHDVYTKDEIAIRFHHALVVIHPFPNGNGRHARLLTDLFLIHFGEKRFSWGLHQVNMKSTVDLSTCSPVRQQYIQALQRADQGDILQLLEFARS